MTEKDEIAVWLEINIVLIVGWLDSFYFFIFSLYIFGPYRTKQMCKVICGTT